MKILFVAHRLPWPPTKGDKIRSERWLRSLAEEHEVWLGTLAESRAEARAVADIPVRLGGVAVFRRPRRARAAFSLATGRSPTEEVFRSRSLLRWVRRSASRTAFDVALGFSSTTAQYLDGLDLPRVMDLVDVDSEKWRLRAGRGPAGRLYALESRRLRERERRILAEFDRVTVVSSAEADRLEDPRGVLEILRNGVDAEHFRPAPDDGRVPGEVIFTGAMDYAPNVEAACWFAGEILPRIRAEVPDATLTIVGSSPTRSVRALARDPAVTVTGTVPDVVPYLSRAEVSVAPLLTGMGVQNKVLEAMAAGLPVVATARAAEGLELLPGRDLLVADDAAGFAREVSRLLGDPALRRTVGRAGRELVAAGYRWGPIMSRMEKLVLEAIR